ncbi:gliding motility-associated C-terminal domain-containing protein [Tenacibaculum amylolyticum]|uniref:gliding motility-associated C-terminal domain-containing protein n=1 Tax=Tenacibaculum amylolyticum TaxID=104269 RepID=UPI0038B626AD
MIVLCSIICIQKSYTQCAGADNSVIICNKEQDVNYQTYSLFNQLSGAPTAGGTWTSENPINNFALNNATGVVNLWSINRFGEHRFTYTNPDCGESATITVFLGGYPGENNINGGANACSGSSNVNLFTFLDNNLTDLAADSNGTWTEHPSTVTGLLDEEFFNAEAAGPGTYTFIYEVDAVETCAAETATVVLEVHREPDAGNGSDLVICDNDDLSGFINIDLFNLLTGEDADGIWEELHTAGQIADVTDSEINVQEIFNTHGPGEYHFQYTVFPMHGVCSEDTEIVRIIIPQVSGAFSVNNICGDQPLVININYDISQVLLFSHDLEFEIRRVGTDEVVYTNSINNVEVTPSAVTLSDTFTLTIPTNPITEKGEFYITATVIDDITGLICDSLTIDDDSFVIYDVQLSTNQLCFDGSDVVVNISNYVDSLNAPVNGTININYTLQDLTNGGSQDIENQEITFTNGEAQLPVDISGFPRDSKQYNITITSPNDTGFDCVDFTFEASLVPEDIQLEILVDNNCNATEIKVGVDAPTLGDGNYTINYEVRRTDGTDVLIDNTIVFNGGNADFNVDIATLSEGDYEIILTSTQNDTNPCRTQFDFEVTDTFSIGGVPDPPVLDENQTFCLANFFPNVPTLSDINITSGDNLTWYDSVTSTTPLDPNTLLVNGTTYFVTASNALSNCESSDRAFVNVSLTTTADITSGNTTPTFCSSDAATLADLDAVAATGVVTWYDAATGGTNLDANTTLVDGGTYFAVENVNGCEHHTKLEFNVTVITPPTPEFTGETGLCALDNLTLADLETQITSVTGFDLLWFDTNEGGNEIDNSELLGETTYYAVYVDPVTDCESPRTAITISLSDCDPEDYDFFIPDGFSPNNDGVNDLYFIPNIAFFYPEYELEIFNRYGQSLFKGNLSRPQWNGTNASGSEVTSGVYFYILRYNKDNLTPKQGRIYLSK